MLFIHELTMLTPALNADSLSSDELSMYHMGMNDAMRMLDIPWQATINLTDQGHDTWLRYYLMNVEVLND